MSVAAASRAPRRAQTQTPYTRHTTDDRDEAEQVLTDLYLPNHLDLDRSSAGLGMEVTGLRLGALTVGRLTYGRPVRVRTAEAENFHVNLPLRGRVASRLGTAEPVTTGPGEGLVFSPGAPAEMSWSAGCEQLCLMISRAIPLPELGPRTHYTRRNPRAVLAELPMATTCLRPHTQAVSLEAPSVRRVDR